MPNNNAANEPALAQSVKENGAELLLRMIAEMKSVYAADVHQASEEGTVELKDWFWQHLDYIGEKFYNTVEEEIGWDNVESD